MFQKLDVDPQTSIVEQFELVLHLIPALAVDGAQNSEQDTKQQPLDGLRRHFRENPKPALVHLVEIITLEERPGEVHR